MERRLTAQEPVDLSKCHQKELDKRIRDRIKAILAYDEGYKYSEISRMFLIDDEPLRRHSRPKTDSNLEVALANVI